MVLFMTALLLIMATDSLLRWRPISHQKQYAVDPDIHST
jgi:hypothetical protein